MDFSEKMKRDRLAFYQEDVDEFNKDLEEFLKSAQAKCVFMIDKEGHLVTKKGFTNSFDLTTLSALVAGSFATTREVARLLGDSEFTGLFHEGKHENLVVSLVGDRALLVVVFDDRTTMGMVRVTAKQLTQKLVKSFEAAEERNKHREPPKLDPQFESSAQEKLDDFFKE